MTEILINDCLWHHQEEEEERSDRWKDFLEQLKTSTQPCSVVKENKLVLQAEASQEQVEGSPERLGEGDDTGDRQSVSDGSSESDHKKDEQLSRGTKTGKVQTWAYIRSSLGIIEDMMSSRVKKRKNMKHEQINMDVVDLPSIKEAGSSDASEEDFEEEVCVNVVNNIMNASAAESDVGDGVSDTVNAAAVEKTIASCVSYRVDTAARPELTVDDGVSDTLNVAVVGNTVNGDVSDNADAAARTEQTAGDWFADSMNIEGTENAVTDGLYVNVSDIGPEKTVDDGLTPGPCFPWREELECLVQGGVPKDLRGEVKSTHLAYIE